MKKISMGPDQVTELSQALRRLSFFQGMSIGELERFILITNLYEYESGKTLFKKGDIGDALYVVGSGQVNIVQRRFPLWPAKTIATLNSGELFGEMALLDQPYRTATAVTHGLTKLYVILTANFNDLLRSNPDFARDLRHIAQTRAFETKNRSK